MTEQSSRTTAGPHQGQPVYTAGTSLEQADTAMILVHGRGATAADILDLARLLEQPQVAYLAPQAANNSWYPFSFLAPVEDNQPNLSSALQVIDDLVAQVISTGIPAHRIMLGGFSQGACLVSEYVARNARRYGGLFIFSGGVIGPLGELPEYEGDLDETPVLIGCSDIDPHIPLERVQETANIFAEMGGEVSLQIYSGMGHTVNQDEIDRAKVMTSSLDV